jgi:torulene dioxygenase
MTHWFNGFNHTYRFQLVPSENRSCKVIYNSHRQADTLVEEMLKTGNLYGISFGQKRDLCLSFFQKLKTVFGPSMVAFGGMTMGNVPLLMEYYSPTPCHPDLLHLGLP